MTSQTTLILTSLAEHLVVYFHGMGMPVAFLVSVVIQLAWAVWGVQIQDTLFVVTGVTLALLNAYFHFRNSKSETKEVYPFGPRLKHYSTIKKGTVFNTIPFKFKPNVLPRNYQFNVGLMK